MGGFKAAHGTLLMAMYHRDCVIDGADSRLCEISTNAISTIIEPNGNKSDSEAKVWEKTVVHQYFVGMFAGHVKVQSVLTDLAKELSDNDNGQTVYINDLLPNIEQKYNDLVEKEKNVVIPSRIVVTAIDKESNKLAVHYFGVDYEKVGCRIVEPAHKCKCFGQGSKEATEILVKGHDIEKTASDMVELMYDTMNTVFARNKLMGGEFHAYIISIENGRLKTVRQDLQTILGNKRKRVAEKDDDGIAHLNLCRELKMK